ncbi:MAG TPA: hypothetical protein DIV39_11290, partial [Verrucomicrobiales bacterium]|nr:hypothetical protein [Verrucomicrobiales bacterium]
MTHPRWFAYTAASLLVPALMKGAEPLPDSEFLKAALTGGSVEGGKLIFADQRTACSQCHSVDGTASGLGPDLYAAGDKFAREDLVQSILDPSSSIMTGYATTILENRKGERFQGILRSRTDEALVLGQVGGVDLQIARSEVVKEETGAVSLMPPGLHSQLSPAEFRDLVAYLESLRQPETKVVQEAGTPLEIPVISQQLAFEPVFGMKEKFQKPVWFGGHPTVQGGYLIAEKSKGTISLLERVNGEEVISPFVNILDEIYVANDEGILGVALHPGFAENGRYFMMHETMTGQQRGMAVVERVASADRRKDSGRPTRSILRWNIDTLFHHGGGLEFGPDGFLYIGMGDGGPQEDPEGKAQDLSRFEGSLLRIDVDREEEGRAYGI